MKTQDWTVVLPQMTPAMLEAKAVVKAINRHVKHSGCFEGGKQWGVDYATWAVTYPQLASTYSKAATLLAGRSGRFMPRF